VIFPAHPEQGEACKKALRYRVNADLTVSEITCMDGTYKTRWPEMENGIKALVAAGFGVNRERSLALTTSRGVDGERQRLVARGRELGEQLQVLRREPPRVGVRNKIRTRVKREREVKRKIKALDAKPVTKGARQPMRGELLCKYLTALLYNALVLLLSRSALPAVRAMTPPSVRALLLGQPAIAVFTADTLTLWIERTRDARERALQEELVRLFADAPLAPVGGRILRLRLQNDTERIRH
jgi:hypothetical protein